MLPTMSERRESAPTRPGRETPPGGATEGARDAAAVHEVCPYLLSEDGAWRSAQPSRDHRCNAVRPPAALTTTKQRSLCLGTGHVDCATFRAAEGIAADRRPAASGGLWPASRSTLLVLEPAGGSVRVRSGGGDRIAPIRIAIVALLALAIVVVVGARILLPPGGEPGASIPADVSSPSASALVSPEPSIDVTPEPTAVPSESPAPTAVPSPTATPVPTKTPAPTAHSQTYTVKSGDTLSGIAAAYHVTIAALRAANGLAVGAVLHPGQVLIIP
jgi:LysM repeat protein